MRGVSATTIIIDNASFSRVAIRVLTQRCLEMLNYRRSHSPRFACWANRHPSGPRIRTSSASRPTPSRLAVTSWCPRSVVINLYQAGHPEREQFSDRRSRERITHSSTAWKLLGELIGMVERWKASAACPWPTCIRDFNKRGWGNIVGMILQAYGEPDFLANAQEAAVVHAVDAGNQGRWQEQHGRHREDLDDVVLLDIDHAERRFQQDSNLLAAERRVVGEPLYVATDGMKSVALLGADAGH